MPHSPSDHGPDPRARSPRGSHGYEEEGRGRRSSSRDGRGRWPSQVSGARTRMHCSRQTATHCRGITRWAERQVKGIVGKVLPAVCVCVCVQDYPLDQAQDERELRRRQEEEYQARYRSDPNLARYPVKPQPSEEAMRVLAQVGRMRHQRRHSDVSLATTELGMIILLLLQGAPQRLSRHRASGSAGGGGQRSYSVERANQASPTSPRRSPVPQQHLDPSSALRRKMTNERGQRMGRLHVIGSFSSSEEELATTPEYTSCDEQDRESECVCVCVYMDGHWWDHGSWHGDTAAMSMQPVTWQQSKDGERLIGRILLNKRMKDGTVPADTGALLGLKVVGGKMTESGRLCAFITKVKRGSLADTVGHLRPGDQVLEWNGRVLQGATFKEVYNIILESKPEPQVELVVSRPIGWVRGQGSGVRGQGSGLGGSSSFESQKVGPSISVTSPMSPGVLRDAPQFLSGQVSVSTQHAPRPPQPISSQTVTVVRGHDL
uniref:PDZ domain-containing protein n=1 Tax=Myripristis murdjan TaxID=586833 RepID=A0A667XTU4_9TELE